jgi:hypothetical protein
MPLKTCPKCLGDVAMDGVCIMCGYALPAAAHPAALAQNQNPASMTTAQQEWPYPGPQLRPHRLAGAARATGTSGGATRRPSVPAATV